MHTVFATLVLRLKQSYWFWPAVLAIGAAFAAWGMTSLDRAWGNAWVAEEGLIRPIDVDGAREILSTVAGAILSTAGVAFSVTIVAVSFASGHYGPRLIGNFMRDRTNQLVLGIFVATFVYAVTVLSTVHGGEAAASEFVPQLSIVVALLLTVAAVAALIVYIHHVPESIDIMKLVAAIGADLRRSIRLMHDGDANERGEAQVAPATDERSGRAFVVTAETSGYIQSYDVKALVGTADAADIVVEVLRAAGEFVVEGEPLLSALPADHVDGEVASRLVGAVTVGSGRTGLQDVFFLSDQLVEVLARALSPSVNDPYTAILCLDWLRSGLTLFAASPPPRPRQGTRFIARPISFEALLTRSVDRMRQHVSGDRTVTLHALAVLADIAVVAATEARAQAVRRAMERLAAAAEDRLPERVARYEVREAHGALLAEIARGRRQRHPMPGETTADEATAPARRDESA